MRSTTLAALALAATTRVAAQQTLDDVCTVEYIQSVLPAPNFLLGVVPNNASITANPVTNYNVSASAGSIGGSGFDFCNVTFSYTHTGLDDTVNLWYWLPSPAQWQGRYLTTGGGGLSITSGQSGLVVGLPHGAVAGTTDGGFGGFDESIRTVILAGNGTLNNTMLVNFAYRSLHELTTLGKQLTAQFYATESFYSYYAGCSEGGREGWSQAQHYGTDFDGLAMGAPAMRQAFQQPLHVYSTLVEVVQKYAPTSCELSRINSDLVAACDLLDGRADGVVSRTDLCKLHYNVSSSIGNSYSCAATSGGGNPYAPGNSGGPTPAVNGTVSAEGVAVAQQLLDGIFDDEGRQAWIMFQPSAGFSDAATTYNNVTGEFEALLSSGNIGVQYINLFLREVDSTSLDISNWTYNDLRDVFLAGMRKFSDTLQTTWPDLEILHDHGAKVIHWHGESDNSVPAGSSVIYQNSVRNTMYPSLGFNESFAELDDWYRLFLVAGAGHCNPSSSQPNGSFPTDILGNLIEWVEDGVSPDLLNATVGGTGPLAGTRQDICKFPLRPLWADNSTTRSCVYDQESIDSWFPTFDSIPLPVW